MSKSFKSLKRTFDCDSKRKKSRKKGTQNEHKGRRHSEEWKKKYSKFEIKEMELGTENRYYF